jgi:hypothetical protein
MFKLLLISIVMFPVLLGMRAATRGRGRGGLLPLLAVVLTYDVLYLLLLYYLRIRWVGWGAGA